MNTYFRRFVRIGLPPQFLAILAVCLFCLNDICIKSLSDLYPLHQIVCIRSILCIFLIYIFFSVNLSPRILFTTDNAGILILRGFCLFVTNTFFFLGVASIPLAENIAVFFVYPLLVILLSSKILGETIKPYCYLCIFANLIGVNLIAKPNFNNFDLGYLFPLIASVCYACHHILTRKIGIRDDVGTVIIFLHSTVLFGSGIFGVGAFLIDYEHQGDVTLRFLFSSWVIPQGKHLLVLVGIGVLNFCASLAIALAYRIASSNKIAPFEFFSLPLALVFGLIFFAELPDHLALIGIAVIFCSGLLFSWLDFRAR